MSKIVFIPEGLAHPQVGSHTASSGVVFNVMACSTAGTSTDMNIENGQESIIKEWYTKYW